MSTEVKQDLPPDCLWFNYWPKTAGYYWALNDRPEDTNNAADVTIVLFTANAKNQSIVKKIGDAKEYPYMSFDGWWFCGPFMLPDPRPVIFQNRRQK